MQSGLLFYTLKWRFSRILWWLRCSCFGQQKNLLSGKSRVSNDKVVVNSLNLENEGVGFSKWKGNHFIKKRLLLHSLPNEKYHEKIILIRRICITGNDLDNLPTFVVKDISFVVLFACRASMYCLVSIDSSDSSDSSFIKKIYSTPFFSYFLQGKKSKCNLWRQP